MEPVRVDVAGVAALATELAAAGAELAAIASATQVVLANPALVWALSRSPVETARAVARIERALLGPRGLTGVAAGYAVLAVDAAGQAADLAAAEAGAAVLRAQWGALDTAAGLLLGTGLRTADLAVVAGGGALDHWIPQGPGVVRDVPAGKPLPPAPTLTDLYGRVGELAVGEVEVAPVLGADGVVRYVVLIRGIEPSLNPTLNTPWQAVKSSRGSADSHSRAVAEALRRAGVPAGSELMLVGHSQGGITAMNVAAAGRYRVTHVVTAGSPIANKRPAARILAIENRGDLVPDLDAVDERTNPQRTVYRFEADRRLSQAAANHSLDSGYLPELSDPRFGADPGVRAYLDSAAPYLLSRPGVPRRFRLDAGPYPPPGLR